MQNRKVAITGMGTINPLAQQLSEYAKALEQMEIGIDRITHYDPTDYSFRIAGEVKNFDPKNYLDKKKAKKYDRFLQFAIAAAKMALEDSKLDLSGSWKEKAAVTVSSGIGGIQTLLKAMEEFHKTGPEYISPFLIPMMIPNMASGAISMEFGLKGPNFATVSACATSLHSIIVSTMMIKHGYADIALAGGAEAPIHPLSIGAFGNMMALSRNNDHPKEASNPFDRRRDGFVMGEGAGVVILEELEHAKARAARIYGIIAGFGMSGDAFDFSASEPDGMGAAQAILQAFETSGSYPRDIDFINAHATATFVGDISEINALKYVFKEELSDIPIQGTKALIAHGLGSAAVNELIAGVLETQHGFIHGMPSLKEPDDAFSKVYLLRNTLYKASNTFLKNAFGFGGHNACIIFKRQFE